MSEHEKTREKRAQETGQGAGTEPGGYLANFLPYQLSIASNAVSSLIAERYRKRFALKIPEWRIMAVLGDSGPLTQRELTAITLMDKVAVNRATKVLEGRGLVARVPNPDDGRSHLLDLTDDGRGIHGEVMPLALATERDLFEGFAPEEREAFRNLLERMRVRARSLFDATGEGSSGRT